MASAVASRYARALVDLVMAPGSALKPEDAVAQLRAAEELIQNSGELRNALLTPAIQTSRKRAVMGRLLDQLAVSRLIRNLIFVVIDRRRIGFLPGIREAVESLLDERMGFARAEVVSAAPLSEKHAAALASELSSLSGKQVRARFSVDAELVGGALARIGSTVYDGSVRGQLQELRRQLTERHAE